jgi:DNA-directed RNA polymerase specialized sigma24 family protein
VTARRGGDYRLTAKQAQALAYADAGLSGRSIARMLGVSAGLIQKRVRRARRLRETQAIADDRRAGG